MKNEDGGIKAVAQRMATLGRKGDDLLVHMNVGEKAFIEHIAGKKMTVNPTTGLHEAFSLWKAILGGLAVAAVPFTGGTSLAALGPILGGVGASLIGSSLAPSSGDNAAADKAKADEIAQKKQQAQDFVKVPIIQNIPSPAPAPMRGLPGTMPEQVAPMQSAISGYIKPGSGYYAKGGEVASAEKIVTDAVAAVQGRYPRPKQALEAFAKHFGADELHQFLAEMQQMTQSAGTPGASQPGSLLDSPSGGMDDKIDGTVNGQQPIKLSGGEFVIPADVVSHLGDGNSKAGAAHLHAMMNRVRQTKTGQTRQPGKINATQMMPA